MDETKLLEIRIYIDIDNLKIDFFEYSLILTVTTKVYLNEHLSRSKYSLKN